MTVSGTKNHLSSDNSGRRDSFLYICLAVFSLKFFIFFLDSLPQFFIGDSEGYLGTAISGVIPTDRSFVFGFIIRFLTFYSHSLTSLIFAQVVSSCLSCIIFIYILRKLGFPEWLAAAAGLVFAVDPLHLLYERYVMTESISFLCFSLFILCCMKFLEKPSWLWLMYLNLAGIMAVMLRLSFLPLIQFGVIACPLLSVFLHGTGTTISKGKIAAKASIWLLISMSFYLVLHTGYKHLNGYLSDAEPSYNYESGYYLLGSWCPLVQPQDFPDRKMADALLPDTYRDITLRESNRWNGDGIITRLKKYCNNDLVVSEKIAATIARNIFFRDPFGVIRQGITTFYHLWNRETLITALKYDRGKWMLSNGFLKTLSENYHIDATRLPFIKTLTNTFFFRSIWWYRILLLSPVFLFTAFFLAKKEEKPFVFILTGFSVLVLLVTTMVSSMPVVRYLHSLGGLTLFGMAVIIRELIEQGRLHRKH